MTRTKLPWQTYVGASTSSIESNINNQHGELLVAFHVKGGDLLGYLLACHPDAKIRDVMRAATAEVREALQLVGDYYWTSALAGRKNPSATMGEDLTVREALSLTYAKLIDPRSDPRQILREGLGDVVFNDLVEKNRITDEATFNLLARIFRKCQDQRNAWISKTLAKSDPVEIKNDLHQFREEDYRATLQTTLEFLRQGFSPEKIKSLQDRGLWIHKIVTVIRVRKGLDVNGNEFGYNGVLALTDIRIQHIQEEHQHDIVDFAGNIENVIKLIRMVLKNPNGDPDNYVKRDEKKPWQYQYYVSITINHFTRRIRIVMDPTTGLIITAHIITEKG